MNKEKNELLKGVLRDICGYIDNGIQDGDIIRKFNLIDYYLLIKEVTGSTKLNLYSCYKDKIISFYQYDKIRKFVTLQESTIMSTTINKLLQIDFRYGDWKMSMQEKHGIVSYLQKNEIPINNVTYVLTVNRYILTTVKKSVKVEDNNSKKLVKSKYNF